MRGFQGNGDPTSPRFYLAPEPSEVIQNLVQAFLSDSLKIQKTFLIIELPELPAACQIWFLRLFTCSFV